MNSNEMTERVRKAMQAAFDYGQTYWAQADSECGPHKPSDETARKFHALVDETCASLPQPVDTASIEPEVAARIEPAEPSVDLRETLIELANTQRKLIDANAEIAAFNLLNQPSATQPAPSAPDANPICLDRARIASLISTHTGLRESTSPDEFAELMRLVDAVIFYVEQSQSSPSIPDDIMSTLRSMVDLHNQRKCVLEIHMDALSDWLAAAPKQNDGGDHVEG